MENVGIDIKSLRKVMIFGAALPLFIYLFWQVVSQGVMSQSHLMASDGLNGFISSVSNMLNNPQISSAITINPPNGLWPIYGFTCPETNPFA